MTEAFHLVMAMAAGVLLGGFYFGGLWWTVRRGLIGERSALWFLGSLLLRTLIVMTGFYLVGRGSWQRLALCLLGFIAARLAVHWTTRPQGTSHAP